MDINETKKLMMLEMQLWPRGGLELRNRTELMQIAETRQKSLADIPFEAGEKAVYALAGREKTPPSIAAIRAEVPKEKRIRIKKPDPPTVNHFGKGAAVPPPKPVTKEELRAEIRREENLRRPLFEALQRIDSRLAELREMEKKLG